MKIFFKFSFGPRLKHSGTTRFSYRKNQVGFTLIEVLMAMVVLTIGIIAVHEAFSRCIAAVRHSEEKLFCAFLLEKKVTDLLISSPAQALERAGDFNDEAALQAGYVLKNTPSPVVRGEENLIYHLIKVEGPTGVRMEAPLLTPVPTAATKT